MISQVLKETCAVFRSLILDDDVRVEFSKAHEHARAIAVEVLITLTKLLEGNCEGDAFKYKMERSFFLIFCSKYEE